jgi:hypothetical protein
VVNAAAGCLRPLPSGALRRAAIRRRLPVEHLDRRPGGSLIADCKPSWVYTAREQAKQEERPCVGSMPRIPRFGQVRGAGAPRGPLLESQ